VSSEGTATSPGACGAGAGDAAAVSASGAGGAARKAGAGPKTVLVTGSSRGIGRAVALRLARDGFDVVVHCRSKRAEADAVAAEIAALGRASRVLQFDVVNRELCAELLTKDVEAYGAYYGVVCNAGLAYDTAFPAMTGEQWDSIIRSNLDAFYNVLQPLIMPMVRRRSAGRIVTMSSVSGLVGNRGQVNYSAAKAGVIGATKALAIELAKRNITVNCVAPGLIDTDMLSEHVPQEEILKMIPMQRSGTAEEVAGAVSFLMSDDAAYVTRQVLAVNGGLC
jgi:3-oxoacyl-[acyl-carrier protein] reductase